MLGAAAASLCSSALLLLTRSRQPQAALATPPDPFGPDVPPLPPREAARPEPMPHDILPDSESVEWVNMCVRKIWRVYQRGLEKWIGNLLQPVFDTYINEDTPPAILKRIRIAQFTLNHEPPVFDNMQRRNSRKESDINGIFSVRYSGGAKMLLVLELGGRLSGIEVPVMVEDFDLDARTWIKLRLAPMCPWVGVISLAFVEAPRIQVCIPTVISDLIPSFTNFLRTDMAHCMHNCPLRDLGRSSGGGACSLLGVLSAGQRPESLLWQHQTPCCNTVGCVWTRQTASPPQRIGRAASACESAGRCRYN